MNLGTLFVDEQAFPVSRITLEEGCFFIWATVDGPVTLPLRSEVRLHDPAGNTVAVAPWHLGDQPASVGAGGRMTICQPVRVTEVDGWPRS
jgi:hypothetical protein